MYTCVSSGCLMLFLVAVSIICNVSVLVDKHKCQFTHMSFLCTLTCTFNVHNMCIYVGYKYFSQPIICSHCQYVDSNSDW